MQLTNVGNIFTAAAIEIVNTYDEVLRKIEEVQRYEPLKVGGVVSDPVVSSIMSIANTFLDEEGYPPPEISPNESEGQESLEQLRQGRIDIAVSFAELELLEKWGLTTYLSQDPNSSHWSILKTPFPRRAESRLTTCEISVSSNMQIAMPRTVGRT